MTVAASGGKRARVRQHVLAEITRLQPNDAVPGERELSAALGVSRMTARAAIQELEADGVVYRRRGAGTFVSEPRVTKNLALTSFTEDMRARGMIPATRVLMVEERIAGTRIARRLKISPQDPVVYMERVRLADGVPMCFEREWFPADAFPGLAEMDVSGSLFELLMERYGHVMVHAEQQILATVLEPAEAAQLDAPVGSPALHTRRVSYGRGSEPAELAESVYRSDRYRFEFTIKRELDNPSAAQPSPPEN